MFQTMLNSMLMLSMVMALGYYLQKKDVLNDNVRSNLTYLLINIVMPATFFMALQLDVTPSLLKDAFIIIGLSTFLHIFFIILGYVTTTILKVDKKNAGVVAFSLGFKNLTYMGLPIVSILYMDNNPSFYITLFCVPFNILAFSLGPMMLSNGKTTKIHLSNFITNINIAVVLGFTCFIFGIKVPTPIASTLSTISQLVIPVSLLLTGALLTKTKFSTIIKDVKLLIITVINLVVLPVIFLFIIKPLNVNVFLKEFSFIMAILPSASMTLILTDRYEGDVDLAGKLVLTSTLFSLITAVLLSGLTYLL